MCCFCDTAIQRQKNKQIGMNTKWAAELHVRRNCISDVFSLKNFGPLKVPEIKYSDDYHSRSIILTYRSISTQFSCEINIKEGSHPKSQQLLFCFPFFSWNANYLFLQNELNNSGNSGRADLKKLILLKKENKI